MLKSLIPTYVKFIPEHKDMEEGKLYISQKYLVTNHLCICGCKNQIVLPIGKDGWRLTLDENNLVSIHPSIGNYQLPCKTHYYIKKNQIEIC